MSNVPEDRRYTDTHEWVLANDDGAMTVGITEHAQELLGDMVFVELPEVGRGVNAKEECGVVESVKAASDIYAPVAGEIVAVNEALADAPELINSDPYGDGWILRIRAANPGDVDELNDAQGYAALVAEEEA
jgi:glycine cleavage system H protein